DDPLEAFPHPHIPVLLEVLYQTYPVYVVSGRFLADLEKLVTLPLDAIGLHGLQMGRIGGEITEFMPPDALHLIRRMRSTVPDLEGIRIEEKGPMFAVHYRLAVDKASVQDSLRQWLAQVPDLLNPIWGKDVVELRPRGISKGTAVLREAAKFPDRTPVYLGDDVTDEDAFRDLGDDGITIKVGDGETAARYRLPDVDAVADYLRRYVG
ncbi:MAG: trehalose-phosphatase, partial [Rhodothermales bacterium]